MMLFSTGTPCPPRSITFPLIATWLLCCSAEDAPLLGNSAEPADSDESETSESRSEKETESTQDAGAESPSSGSNEAPSGCAQREESACEAECQSITSADGVYRGCMDASVTCTQVFSCARNAQGEQAQFNNGCLPDGWTPCELSPPTIPPNECEVRADCAFCEYQAGPPALLSECKCPFGCKPFPRARLQCEAITARWEPLLCQGDALDECHIADCLPPQEMGCVDNRCVVVEDTVNDVADAGAN